MNKISIAITNYNRTDLLFESIHQVINDDRIDEIVISDDCSDYNSFNSVCDYYREYSKVKIFRNDSNVDCYRNKKEAISNCSNEWVIMLDSDNIITKEYIDRIETLSIGGLDRKTIYQPSFAKPHFDFRKYEGYLINRINCGKHIHEDNFSTMLNAMNYFVNRDEYIRVWDGSVDPVTSDSLFQNYNWLKGGNRIYVVPGLSYEHRVHPGSHYQNNVNRTPSGFHDSIIDKLKKLAL
jgi:glycosyltransferase involved in cell wall biosynthesis